MTDFAKLREMYERATPGTWIDCPHGGIGSVEEEELAAHIADSSPRNAALIVTMHRLFPALLECAEALGRAAPLLRLLTTGQILLSGEEDAVQASGLNPWAINEGLAKGDEPFDPWFAETALSSLKEACER